MMETLTTAIFAGALASALTWHFPPLLWLKDKLKVSETDYLYTDLAEPELDDTYSPPRAITRPLFIRLITKLLNCATCMGWWIGLGIFAVKNYQGFITQPISQELLLLSCAIISSMVSELLYKMFKGS